jgi:hypothetical protein
MTLKKKQLDSSVKEKTSFPITLVDSQDPPLDTDGDSTESVPQLLHFIREYKDLHLHKIRQVYWVLFVFFCSEEINPRIFS